ncbi:MAG TPA: hypothetical protein VG537_01730 [Candidatus Kapabacteria bacterium]|jgi:hypothetical protein|nr:hypothetical protein [Candidatus Kapabacteria bacterium]
MSSRLLLTLTLCAIILSCTLSYPFNNDNALYAYMADLALKGHFPYTGSWDQNFPGILLIHAVQILLSGHSQFAFHVFDIALQLVGSFLFFKIGTLLYDKRAGMLAAILASLYYVQQGLWMSGERDTYVSIMLLAAFYFTIEAPSHLTPNPLSPLGAGVFVKRPFIIGLLCGFAFLFRPTYAPYALVFLIWILVTTKRWRATLLGSLLPIAVTVIVYAITGGLTDFWDATILFNLKVYGGSGASFNFWEPVRFYAISIIAVVIGGYYLWKSERPIFYLWLSLFAASVLSLVALYRHSVYHYHPAMTLFLLLSAIGWIYLSDLLGARWKILQRALPFILVFFFVFQTFRGNTVQHVLLDIAHGNIHSLNDGYDRYEPSSDFGVDVQRQVGEYLKDHTHPDDTVQMFGPYSYPQYYAGLQTASRFQTLHAITMRGMGDTLQPFQKAWRVEYMIDMQRSKPIYFIVCDAPEAFRQYYGGRLGHEILRDDFQELGVWLRSNYYPETKIGAFTLYRRIIPS